MATGCMIPMPNIGAFAIVAFITLTGNVVSSLQCYKCSFVLQKNSVNETVQLCSSFNYSQRYMVDCPFSTMCLKKTFELKLPHGDIIKGTERGCASQKYEHQAYEDGKWHLRYSIEEPYEEICLKEDSEGVRLSPPEYCYCRRNLCNAAPSNDRNEVAYHVDAMAVIFVFNALKYFRSME